MLDNIFGKPLIVQEWLRNQANPVDVKTTEQPLLLLLPPISAQGGPSPSYSQNSEGNNLQQWVYDNIQRKICP